MAIQSYILATGQAAEAAALLPGADQPSIGSIEFGDGHTLSDASTVGLETPLAPPQSTTQINYATPVGGEAKLGYQVGGSAEFNFSEILLRLDDAGKTAYARIVDTVGDLNGKNASQILVGLLNVAYTNPPQASGLVATTAAPLAMLSATEDNMGAVRLASKAEARAGAANNRALTPEVMAGSAISPQAAPQGRIDALTDDGFYEVSAVALAAAADKPGGVAAGAAIVQRAGEHWVLIDAGGAVFTRVGAAGSWHRASGRLPDVQKFSAPGNYQWAKPAGAQRVLIELKPAMPGARGGFYFTLGSQGYAGFLTDTPANLHYALIDIRADYLPAQCPVIVPAGGAGGAGSSGIENYGHATSQGVQGGAGANASFNGWSDDLLFAIGKSTKAQGGVGGGGNHQNYALELGKASVLPLIFGAGGNAGTSGAPNGQPGGNPSGNGGAGFGQNGRGGKGGDGEVIVTTYF